MFDVKKKLGIQEKRDIWMSKARVSARKRLQGNRLTSSFDGGEKIDKDSRLSPHIEFESTGSCEYKLVREMLPPGKNTDWIWDWSGRQEAVPPKYVLSQKPVMKM
ncbi:unnamed protein product, partial [Mesorhabditis spiculigera]